MNLNHLICVYAYFLTQLNVIRQSNSPAPRGGDALHLKWHNHQGCSHLCRGNLWGASLHLPFKILTLSPGWEPRGSPQGILGHHHHPHHPAQGHPGGPAHQGLRGLQVCHPLPRVWADATAAPLLHVLSGDRAFCGEGKTGGQGEHAGICCKMSGFGWQVWEKMRFCQILGKICCGRKIANICCPEAFFIASQLLFKRFALWKKFDIIQLWTQFSKYCLFWEEETNQNWKHVPHTLQFSRTFFFFSAIIDCNLMCRCKSEFKGLWCGSTKTSYSPKSLKISNTKGRNAISVPKICVTPVIQGTNHVRVSSLGAIPHPINIRNMRFDRKI